MTSEKGSRVDLRIRSQALMDSLPPRLSPCLLAGTGLYALLDGIPECLHDALDAMNTVGDEELADLFAEALAAMEEEGAKKTVSAAC